MPGRREGQQRTVAAPWSRRRMVTLLVFVLVTGAVLAVGLVLFVAHGLRPTPHNQPRTPEAPNSAPPTPATVADARDVLAGRPMPSVPESAAHPGAVSTADPGAPILLPLPAVVGPAGVPTGFAHTPEGALAQLAAIDQTALQSGSLAGARVVIAAWALPGGPTTTSWSGVLAMSRLLDAAGVSGGGSAQMAVVLTPLMGLMKGSVGPDFVVPCIDFELDLTLQQTARGAVADCQRMVWHGDRWLIGSGEEPATPPSVWPDTDTAIRVGYRDLRRE